MKPARWFFAVVVATMAAGGLTSSARGDESAPTPVPMDQLPAPVQDALLSVAKGKHIIQVVEETVDGQTVYVARIRSRKDVMRVEVTADGTVLEKETNQGD